MNKISQYGSGGRDSILKTSKKAGRKVRLFHWLRVVMEVRNLLVQLDTSPKWGRGERNSAYQKSIWGLEKDHFGLLLPSPVIFLWSPKHI